MSTFDDRFDVLGTGIDFVSLQVCGKIKVFCFDKTGTLTEDGLDIKGLHPARGRQFDPFMETSDALDRTDIVLHSLGTCHSLARLHKKNPQPGEPDSEIIGDPLEIKMFDMTRWHLHEPRVGTGASKLVLQSIMNLHTVVIPTHADHGHVSHTETVRPSIPVIPGDPKATCFAMIRQFTFSSALQRMAIIVGATDGEAYRGPLFIYAKV